MSVIEEQVKKYFDTCPTSLSGQFMALYLGYGIRIDVLADQHPSNPEKMWGCLRLLDECPSLREKLDDLRVVSKGWDAAVNHWQSLEMATRVDKMWIMIEHNSYSLQVC